MSFFLSFKWAKHIRFTYTTKWDWHGSFIRISTVHNSILSKLYDLSLVWLAAFSLSLVNQFALVRCDHRISEHFILVIHDEPLDAQKRGATQKGFLSMEHTTFVFWLEFRGKFDKIFSICTINVYRIPNHMYYLFTWQYLPSDYIGKYNKHSINCFKCRPTGIQFMLLLSVIEKFHLFDV